MPFKNHEVYLAYQKGYYTGYRKATLDHLISRFGNGCFVCGSTENLEIDHIKPIDRKGRSLKDLKDLSKLRILCKSCNRKLNSYAI